MAKTAPWKTVMSVRKKKNGEGTTILVTDDVTLKKGTYLVVEDPRKSLDGAVERGNLDADKAEEYKARIPDYVLFDVKLPPRE